MSKPLHVLLGVTGGIAAIKAPALVRELRARGHEVRCTMTRGASSFVAPLALEVLTGAPVYGEEYLEANGSGEELHVTAAEWADLLCIAPVTAHTLARLALGLADDFLTTTTLMHEGPIVLAPAMHSTMWGQPTVVEHVEALGRRGIHFVGPTEGELASGESGVGRMSEVEEIADAVELAARASAGPLSGRRVVVSAGPTEEPVDDVRFLTNRSSGRMGFAVAKVAAERGAEVELVAGPVGLATPRGVSRIDVRTAAEMNEAVRTAAGDADLVVMAAAVADFRPRRRAEGKLKKADGMSSIELERTTDILAGLREVAPDAVLVGFAAESGDPEREARRKLESKSLDFIVANDISRSDIGFQARENEVTIYARDGSATPVSRRAKGAVAERLLDLVEKRMGTDGPQAVASGR